MLLHLPPFGQNSNFKLCPPHQFDFPRLGGLGASKMVPIEVVDPNIPVRLLYTLLFYLAPFGNSRQRDVVSGVAVDLVVGMAVHLKLGGCRSNRSRVIRLSEPLTLWWTNDNRRRSRHTAFCLITPAGIVMCLEHRRLIECKHSKGGLPWPNSTVTSHIINLKWLPSARQFFVAVLRKTLHSIV